jgi:hypothetical protein
LLPIVRAIAICVKYNKFLMFNLNPELITKDGKPMFAVIPYEQFLAIKEMLEDFQDLQDLRVAKQEEYSQPAIALHDVKQMLGL